MPIPYNFRSIFPAKLLKSIVRTVGAIRSERQLAHKSAALRRELNSEIASVDRSRIYATISALGFNESASFSHVNIIYKHCVSGLITKLYQVGRLNEAELLVHLSFVFYALRLDSEKEFNNWIASFSQQASVAGERLSVHDRRPGKSIEPLVLAFITRAGPISNSTLDHILPIIQHLNEQGGAKYRILLYFMYSAGSDVLDAAERLGVEVKVADPDGTMGHGDQIVALRDMAHQDRVDVAVWVHAFDAVFALFGLRAAPIQILFSQYLHPRIRLSSIDAQITYGSPVLRSQIFNKAKWRVIPSCVPSVKQKPDKTVVEELRIKFGAPAKTLIGTLARAEKIAQPDYLAAIITLLRRNPDVVFLWTGITEHKDVQEELVRAGIADQTRFVGWVDIKIFCRVIDLHCDTFPMCNGLTLLDSMSAGTACISTDSLLSYFGRDLVPATRAKWEVELPKATAAAFRSTELDRLSIASNPRHYIRLAETLIKDVDKRRAVGESCRSIYRELYANSDLMGAAFAYHLEDIVQRHSPG